MHSLRVVVGLREKGARISRRFYTLMDSHRPCPSGWRTSHHFVARKSKLNSSRVSWMHSHGVRKAFFAGEKEYVWHLGDFRLPTQNPSLMMNVVGLFHVSNPVGLTLTL